MHRSLVPFIFVAFTVPVRAAEPSPEDVFTRRIVPIFKSSNPSSCVQCHLAGVDLKDYILPSSEKTFRSLRDQGLIDTMNPDASKILKLIRMGDGQKQGAALIHETARKAEIEAFSAWVKACCADAALRDAPALDEADRAKPAKPVEVIRHARTDRLLESFENNVWAWRFRCMNCHTEGTPQNDKLVREHGKRVAWVKKSGPAATMEAILAGRLIDTKSPEDSLLIAKPLGAVEHGGGKKFLPGDEAYKGFRAWVEDVAAVRTGKYARANDLPKPDAGPARFGTDIWFKLANTPAGWGDKLLQADVYAWDPAKKAWEPEPIATSDRGVADKARLWQHNLTLLAAKDSARAKAWEKSGKPTLPPGKYLVKLYVDGSGRLAKDWKAAIGEGDYVGRAEFEARWAEGYGAMTVVDAGRVAK
jgi:hypothetical protein